MRPSATGCSSPAPARTTIVEPTSGNTGIALAFVAAARGYPLILTMPETMSLERRSMLKAFGAELVLTEGPKGMSGAIAKAEEIAASDPKRYWVPQQFKNPANPQVHFETTGPEIWNDTDGKVDIFISGVGTGGTITGVSRYIKHEKKRSLLSVAVEPDPLACPHRPARRRAAQARARTRSRASAPASSPTCSISRWSTTSSPSPTTRPSRSARRLHREEGITAGISSGAAVAAAVKVAQRPESKGKLIVVVLPDAGERYLSSVLFEGIAA